MASGSGSPCGACKFLRRKCAADCVFAPYFCSEQGPARFAAIHKVFGASNVSKLLLHVPAADRCEAVVTIAYEAQARIRDPVYGCVAHIFALQQQVAYLQAQVMQAKAQLAQNVMRNGDQNQWNCGAMGPFPAANYSNFYSSISPQSSLDSIDQQETQSREDIEHYYTKKRPSQTDLSELQALALRMINNQD
ncbi:LOB domain-containing protein 16-like isoform X1 [Salvia splendens]|uniref:LOB domain-containing protein 16-like isoform X1 n=1 Tax=Salvia splendens TaxID=180675 RepID=UPI001102B256|nr:LOB domain-containing protein 16-like isoform X1 [Salvia splendens]